MIIVDQKGAEYIVGDKLAKGGQGTIYKLHNSANHLYKQFKNPTPELEDKIKQLKQLKLYKGSDGVVLPISPTYTVIGIPPKPHFTGLLMPYVQNADNLYSYLDPNERVRFHSNTTFKHLYLIAHNLASQFAQVHSWSNTVIGDVNFSNILVTNDQLLVRIIDFDSVQFTNGKVYPCPVGMPEFTPPEGRGFGNVVTKEHDLFALAILIFMLLRQGEYPFRGKPKLPIDEPNLGLYFKNNRAYPYVNHRMAGPPDDTMPYRWLEPEIRNAFNRTFHFGASDPKKRVTAAEWQRILRSCIDQLQKCPHHPEYHYGYHLKSCPWCQVLK